MHHISTPKFLADKTPFLYVSHEKDGSKYPVKPYLFVEVTDEFWANHLDGAGNIRVRWATEGVPMMNERWGSNKWTEDDAGSRITPEEYDARKAEAVEMVRERKKPVLEADLELRLKKHRAEVISTLVNELNYPDSRRDRMARALLRHWFNRPGTDGRPRHWWTGMEQPGLKNARMSWALGVVAADGYAVDNPPRPPLMLYAPGDVRPTGTMMLLPDGVEAVSREGGEWLWRYMRALRKASFPVGSVVADVSTVDESAEYWDEDYREAQRGRLVATCADFVRSLNEMSRIPDATAAVKTYTGGSGQFNRYLLWGDDTLEPSQIPGWGCGAGGAAGCQDPGEIGPPELVHRLYKLMSRAPRLMQKAVFLRSVNSPEELPHNLSGHANPDRGAIFVSTTFMSTSIAPPDDFVYTELQSFYNEQTRCCVFAITVPAGVPVLPVVFGRPGLTDYEGEQEVVLPPGLLLIYQGRKELHIDPDGPEEWVHFYQAAPPPLERVAVPPSSM